MLASASGVLYAPGQTEAALETEGGAEHPALSLHVGQHRFAGVGDVLAEHPDAFVLLHLFLEGAPDGFAEGDDLALAVVGGFGRGVDIREGHHVVADGGRIGPGGGQGPAGGRQHRLAGVLLDLGHLVSGQHPALEQRLFHDHQGIVSGLVRQLLRRAVLALGVLRRVGVGPGHGGMDERRAYSGPDLGHDVGGPGAHLEVVAPVETMDVEAAEATDQLRDGRRRLIRRGDRDGEAVVGHHVEDGEVEAAGGVEAFPELALRGGTLAEGDVGQLVAMGDTAGKVAPGDIAAGFGAPHRGQALAAGGAGLGHDVEGGVAPVAGHLPPAGRRIGGRSHGFEQDFLGGDTEGEHERPVPVIGEKPVVGRPQLPTETEQQGLVPGARDLEKDPALLLEGDLPVVQEARHPGGGEIRSQLVNRDAPEGGWHRWRYRAS